MGIGTITATQRLCAIRALGDPKLREMAGRVAVCKLLRENPSQQPLRHDHGALLFEVQHDGDALARTGRHAMTGARDLDREAAQQVESGV